MSFERHEIQHSTNFFPLLEASVTWQDFSKGRRIATIHRPNNSDKHSDVPLVRTTTVYHAPSQPFSPVHGTIVAKIRDVAALPSLQLNNAMLEVYDSRYTTMKFHTDQALDLHPDSYICLFSCYEKGPDDHPRVLTVQNKDTKEEFQVPLLHHSVVIFSTAMNQKHVHKIEAKGLPNHHDNKWMGLTLRLSKTFVRFTDGVPNLVSDGSVLGELTLATNAEQKDFFGYKGSENRETNFEYPDLRYTISPSDRMPTTAT